MSERSIGKQIFTTLLASEIRGELLTLFHRNPGLIDTIEGVARRIGRTPAVIEPDLQALTELGILIRKRIGQSEVIKLDRAKDRELLETVANHVKSIEVGG